MKNLAPRYLNPGRAALCRSEAARLLKKAADMAEQAARYDACGDETQAAQWRQFATNYEALAAEYESRAAEWES
jgi:hypothetical protein